VPIFFRGGGHRIVCVYLALGAPLAIAGRQHDGTEAIDRDAKDSVDGAEADGVVEQQGR